MQLSEIKGEYDIAVSLGAPCQVAEQLRRHGLRTFSGPFDWTVLESVDCLIKAIDNRFQNYFHIDHLEIRGKHDHTWLIFDKEYQCMSVHDFPLVPEEHIFDYYPKFIEKMTRRIDRFYKKIETSKKTLFVRMHSSYEDTVKLSECLKNLTQDRYTLIVVNETESFDLIEENWNIPNTYAARIRQTPDMPWQGYDIHWNRIFHQISVNDFGKNVITFSANGTCDFYLGTGWHNQEEDHRWTSKSAELVLPFTWRKTQTMEIKTWSFPYSGKTEVYCNNSLIGTIENSINLHTVVFTIPVNIVESCEKQNIRFVTTQAVSPSKIEKNDDTRVLGIAIQSVTFFPQQDH